AAALHRQYAGAVDRAARSAIRETAPSDAVGLEDLTEVLRDSPEWQDALDRMWPLLRPEELLHDLFGAPSLVDLAAAKLLADHERAALHRPRSQAFGDIEWTVADVALLDEVSVLLGPRRRRPDAADVIRTYGHVVVDETQDLSPMQLRMVARRSLNGSMTAVGDIGQATGPFSPAGWHDVVRHLPARKPVRQVELTVNYRTPAEIMEVAARVLRAAAPHLAPPRSVRSGGLGPQVRRADGEGDLPQVALAEAAALSEELGGTVAVLCPAALAGPLGAAREEDVSLEAQVSVIAVGSAKGLEFDGVVVVEPGLVADESPQGLRALYVALTRTTKRLTIVHARPLPAVLGLG
ncbi:MAG: ATP-binding domain-containing protein, partial [Actinobacteria bacterium]|nr:ATP-binding domain-containing protein [Actinomycetota bacterium]